MNTLFPENISDTDLTLWSMCQYRWFRSRCQRLTKPTFNIDLSAGGAFARGIYLARDAFYCKGVEAEEAVTLGYNYIVETLNNAEEQDTLKSPIRMGTALLDYFLEFPLESDEVIPVDLPEVGPAIEYRFEIELPIIHPELGKPIKYVGVIDMLGEYMGRNYVVDEKTCKKLGKATSYATAGQQIGYASAISKLGVEVNGFLIRQVAIQKSGNKIQQLEIAMTDFMIDRWEQSMLSIVTDMVKKYLWFIQKTITEPTRLFIPDYKLGCTAYFKPCPFVEGCSSKYGDNYIRTEFEQLCSIRQKDGTYIKVPLAEYKKKLGLP